MLSCRPTAGHPATLTQRRAQTTAFMTECVIRRGASVMDTPLLPPCFVVELRRSMRATVSLPGRKLISAHPSPCLEQTARVHRENTLSAISCRRRVRDSRSAVIAAASCTHAETGSMSPR
jgi:predicted nuclease with RNAse H fold